MRASRRVRNRIATVAMFVAFLVAAVPLVVMGANVLVQGIGVVTDVDWWTQPIPGDVGRADLADNEQLNDLGFGSRRLGGPGRHVGGAGHAARHRRHLPDRVRGVGHGHPAGHHGRDLPQRVRQEPPPGPVHPVHDRRDDRRAVGRHGCVHLLHLGPALRDPGQVGLRRVARPWPASCCRSSCAPPRRCCGSSRTRCGRPRPPWAPGRGRPPSRWSCPPPCPASPPAPCWPWPGPRARRRPSCSPSASSPPPTGATEGQNTTLSAQIYSQLQNGGDLATQLAWGAAVTLIGIVVGLTLIARFITRRFATQ